MALPLFAVTLFCSAFILFLIQPMIGKLILPKLGGTPQVWNTCMVFFQTALLAGYAYTHTSSTRFSLRRQLLVHSLLLFVPFVVLLPFGGPFEGPFRFDTWTPPMGGNPILSTLGILTLLVGLPFVVVATSAPLLQRWFVHTGHPAAKDPYFLYGASNLGSLLALLAYPVFIEPAMGLQFQQPWFWTALYGALVVLVLACAVMVWQSPPLMEVEIEPPPIDPPVPPEPASTAVKPAPVTGVSSRKKFGKRKPGPATAAPSVARTQEENFDIRPDVMTNWRRIRWVLLAAAPSSLMLGVTSYICTDLSPIPFLWVVPLALYLLTFILVFMRWPIVWIGVPHQVVLFLQPLLVLYLTYLLIQRGFHPIQSGGVAVAAFFLTGLVCHGELARDRPKPAHLTEFYLWMSVGGMLGGMFNGLVAPLLFTGIVEFPLAIVLGCLLRPQQKTDGWSEDALTNIFPNLADSAREKGDEMARAYNRTPPHSTYLLNYTLDFIIPIVIGLLTLALLMWVSQSWLLRSLIAMSFNRDDAREWVRPIYYIIVAIVPMALCFLSYGRPIRLGLGVGAILLAHMGYQAYHDDKVIYAGRSYFGVLRVRETEVVDDRTGEKTGERYHSLMHGTTHHGLNYQPTTDKYSRMATTYYHNYGPAGMVMKQYNWFQDGFKPMPPAERAGPKEWLKDMIRYTSDARMPASLVGAMAGDLTGPLLPVTTVVDLWSEPPYATIGLGTGTMASYARPLQHCHYYEIDDKIRQLNLPTSGTPFFNYLTEARARGAEVQVRMGDARLRMAFDYKPYNDQDEIEGVGKGGGPDGFYHMMVVDAFSSDAIPVHLITKEAIEMYFEKLTPEGILCVHTSNRHVDLVPAVEAVARSITKYSSDGKQGLACLRAHDSSPYGFPGHFTSEWVMVARSMDLLTTKNRKPGQIVGIDTPPNYELYAKQRLIQGGGKPENIDRRPELWKYWMEPRELPDFRALRYPWTDDYSNVLSLFRWR